jgi:hypothetical protein
MVKKQELRVGNLVMIGMAYCKVLVIGRTIIETEEAHAKYKNLEPIPITEEVLINNLNFTIGLPDEYCLEGFVDYIKLIKDEKNNEWDFYYAPYKGETGTIITSVKHLHQLQNLIFSLSGEELGFNSVGK